MNGRSDHMHKHHQIGTVCSGHHQALHCQSAIHRYANGFGIYGTSGETTATAGIATCARGFGYRRQQFGKWPEEPIFGSRYAFEVDGLENGGGSARKNSKAINKKKGKLEEIDKEMENKTESHKEGINMNRYTIDRGHFMDTHTRQNVSLIKSSSIDTIAVSIWLFCFHLKRIVRKKLR